MINTLPMNLQLFAGEKTEKATPKKRKESREKGQVLKSNEINTALSLFILLGLLKYVFPFMFHMLQNIYTNYLTINTPLEEFFTKPGLQKLSAVIIMQSSLVLAPILVTALLAGLVINYGQVGFLFTTKTLAVKLDRINPLEGFKRIFSKRSLVEFLKSLIKLTVVGGIVYMEFIKNISEIPSLIHINVASAAAFIGQAGLMIGFKTAGALLVLALFDYLYQWWDFEKKLLMTKQEVKDEYKQTEGDPQIRSRIKEKQREMGMKRMMQEIPKADVIITNPTHFAVALKYDPSSDQAPKVIAKGQDFVALKMKEIAKENDISIVENIPLARTLYHIADIGSPVPEELFHAVAEVLAFVYHINKSKQS